jgi:hypothetical protein
MALNITQAVLDRAALVVIVGEDGLYEWSATKGDAEVAECLRRIADEIEAGTW